jgi:hypothetical protein
LRTVFIEKPRYFIFLRTLIMNLNNHLDTQQGFGAVSRTHPTRVPTYFDTSWYQTEVIPDWLGIWYQCSYQYWYQSLTLYTKPTLLLTPH